MEIEVAIKESYYQIDTANKINNVWKVNVKALAENRTPFGRCSVVQTSHRDQEL